MSEDVSESGKRCIYWFRCDLRLHDMPSLSAALKKCSRLYPVYIFDENDLQHKKIAYNRWRFILESLDDINTKLQLQGGRLYVFKGKPSDVFSNLLKTWNISCLSYEEDPLPTWKEVERSVHNVCRANNVEIIKKVSRTLWNLNDILEMNKGQPPVTYEVFCHVVDALGLPPKPEPPVTFQNVVFPDDRSHTECVPRGPEELNVQMECAQQQNKVWPGGETRALQHLEERLQVERDAIKMGLCMPNQAQPDLLGPPMSMSAALSQGCLSVRKFYWSLSDLYQSVDSSPFVPNSLMSQLLWREYFYAMCVNNPNYGKMVENPICLNIPWSTNDRFLQLWSEGRTGFPFIDAAMRQLHQEGWLHHVSRNAVACFLTRGDLWISWEEGFKVFMKYLIDADFPICAGNWMWVSSSAFENILQCPTCISPVSYGRHFEPTGNYIRKYIPELNKMPTQYIFEPWLAPKTVQETACCIVGKDYPYPIINHQDVAEENTRRMDSIQQSFMSKSIPLHCGPSSASETRVFMWLPEKCIENLTPCKE